MAARLIAPKDEFSGMPLPLMPRDEELPLDNGDIANWHHLNHPKTDPVLANTLGGKALRSSQVQLVAVKQHNYSEEAYHFYYERSQIASETGQQIGLLLLTGAGYVPDKAIVTTGGEPKVLPMTEGRIRRLRIQPEVEVPDNKQVERFWSKRMPDAPRAEAKRILSEKWQQQAEYSYRNMRYGYDPMKAFFSDVVTGQDMSHLPGMLVDEFMANGNVVKGMSILAQAAVATVETNICQGVPVDKLYKQARADGKLHPCMPPHPASLLKYKLGDYDSCLALLPKLRARMIGAGEAVAS